MDAGYVGCWLDFLFILRGMIGEGKGKEKKDSPNQPDLTQGHQASQTQPFPCLARLGTGVCAQARSSQLTWRNERQTIARSPCRLPCSDRSSSHLAQHRLHAGVKLSPALFLPFRVLILTWCMEPRCDDPAYECDMLYEVPGLYMYLAPVMFARRVTI